MAGGDYAGHKKNIMEAFQMDVIIDLIVLHTE